MATIWKRGRIWYLDGYDLQGKRVQKSLKTGDKGIAESVLRDFDSRKAALRLGIKQSTVSYNQFKEDFLEYCRREKSYRECLRARTCFNSLEQRIPINMMLDITPDLLSELKDKMKKGGMGHHGINRNIRGIKTAMYWAEEKYSIPVQNWKTVKYLPVKENREDWYTIEQVKSLLLVSNGLWKTACYLGVRCGLRPAEIYHARADNIDLSRALLHVTKVKCDCSNCLNSNGLWSPKTKQSDRWIPLEPDVLAYIKSLADCLKSPWLISDNEGHRPTYQSFNVYLKRVIKNAGLPGCPYTLRHTFASQLVSAGVPLKKVSVLMGHASIKMTERYAHLSPEGLHDEAARLPQLNEFDAKLLEFGDTFSASPKCHQK